MPLWWNGRHAALRTQCREAWGFESLQGYQNYQEEKRTDPSLLSVLALTVIPFLSLLRESDPRSKNYLRMAQSD